jgi:PST family polysaccharide transporter
MLDKIVAVTQKLGPGLRQVISNTAWVFAEKIIQMGLSLLVGVWVTRYLGPTQFGTLTYAMTFVSMFGAITSLGGLGGLVVRDMARDPACKDESLGTAFVLQVMSGILTVFLAVGTVSLLNPHETLTHWLVAILAAGTIFSAFNTTIDIWFQSQLQSKYSGFAKNSAYVFMCAVRLVLIQIKAQLIMFAWSSFVETALAGLGLAVVYRSQGNPIQAWRVSLRRAKELLQECWPLILSGFAVYIYADIDQLMLGSMLNDNKAQVGFYAAAIKISRLLDMFPMILASSIVPKLAQLKDKNPEEYSKKIQTYFDISTAFWLATALPISILSPYIIQAIYGKNFTAAIPILSLYVWSQFNSLWGVARSTVLNVERKLHLTPIFTVTGAFINIGLNYLLIPNYGAMGATIATIITYLIVIVLINFVIKDLRFVGLMIVRSFNFYAAFSRLKVFVR